MLSFIFAPCSKAERNGHNYENTVKKNLCTFIAVIVAASATIVFAGCSDNGAPQASTGSEGVASQTSDDASAVSQTKQPAKKRETIKIDDIAWNVDQGIVDGENMFF